MFIAMHLSVLCLLATLLPTWAITNNADLIWYDKVSGEAHNYNARQPIPEGLIATNRIKVNQKLPVLWQVKFAFFDDLEELLVDECGVNEIKPGTFRDLKPLANLSLTFNNLREIKGGVFNFVEIRSLNFSHNGIVTVAADAFDGMPSLERLVLDFNELRRWSGAWFFNSASLRAVSATHNFLEELPARAFVNVDGADVHLGHNKIARIDRDAFDASGSFGDLFLDWNDLERVEGRTFAKLTSVKHLNLDGDSLRCLSDEFLDGVLNKTRQLSVRHNPLKCECLRELKKRPTVARINLSQQQGSDC